MSDHVIGYCRVSTTEQEENGHGLDAQQARIDAEAAARDWAVEWVTEAGSARTLRGRPGLRDALQRLDADDGPTTLVVAKLDRLSRSTLDFGRMVERAMSHGWNLVALDVGVDLSSPGGEMVANVMMAIAQWERRVIAQRTSEGLQEAKRKGTRLGRPVTIPQPVRERIAAERDEGHSLKAIAAGLSRDGVPRAGGGEGWWPSTVQSVLRSLDRDAEAAEAGGE